jgi:hypothetical protein
MTRPGNAPVRSSNRLVDLRLEEHEDSWQVCGETYG